MNLTGRPIHDKPARVTSHPLRKNARGQTCALRLDCCNGDTQTTVLAHLRHFGWAGTSQKPDDLLAVFACSACHDAIDGRTDVSWGYDDLLRAMGETLLRQQRDGILRVGK